MYEYRTVVKHYGAFLTELYVPKNTLPEVDIIFVHGLNPINQKNYAFQAWTAPNGILWPRDLLPHDVPDARVLLFSYNSNVAFNVSQEGVRDHANSLLERLTRNRNLTEHSINRPIIFVAHSLGGLVIKQLKTGYQALVTAVHNERSYGSIKHSTRALVFFVSAIGGQVNNNLLRYLAKNSLLTQISNEDFSYQWEDYRVVTFFETRATKLKKAGIFGRAFKTVVVDAQSAKVGLAGHREIQISMDSDHTNLCKFGAADSKYEPVAGQLKSLVQFCIDQNRPIQNSPLGAEFDAHFMVPYAYNTAFAGREVIIDHLKDRLSNQSHHRRFALWGLGGVGKTQIALEYAYSLKNKCSVFWVNAANYTRFSHDYREIAKIAQLHEHLDGEDLLFETRRWLESPRSGPWIMIIDNADNLLEMFPPVSKDKKHTGLSNFLPQGSKGTILITTRDRIVASRLANMDILEVKAMEPREAGALFLRYAPDAISSGEDEVAFPRLLEALKFLPLAIVGAAAFMRENCVSSSEYFELYSKSKQTQSELLCSEFNDFRRGSEVPEAVLTTYFTLFERLQRQCPMAADFLRLIAYFDWNDIPKNLLSSSGLEGAENPVQFTKAIGTLLSFSLMTRSVDGLTYRVHRLVHMSIESFFPDEDGKWKSRAIGILLDKFGVSMRGLLDVGVSGLAVYLPHVLAIVKTHSDVPTPATAALSGRLGGYLCQMGHIEEGEPYLRNYISSGLGIPRSKEFLSACLYLGNALETREQDEEATKVYFDMIEDYESLLELSVNHHGHIIISTVIDRLLKLYAKPFTQRTFSLARLQPICLRMVKFNVQLYGRDHVLAIVNILILAKLNRLQRNYNAANDLYGWAVTKAKDIPGWDVYVLNCLIKLAKVNRLQGRYIQAQRVLDEAVEVSKRIRVNNGFALRYFVRLARALAMQISEQAEAILQRAVEMLEALQKQDVDGSATEMLYHRLEQIGNLYSMINQPEKASQLYFLAVARTEQALGASHLITLDTLSKLGYFLMEQGAYTEAEAVVLRAQKGFENKFGLESSFTLKRTLLLGLLLGFQGRHAEAKSVCERVLEGYKNTYGVEHTATLKAHAVVNHCLSEHNTEGMSVDVKTTLIDAVLQYQRSRPCTPPPPPPPSPSTSHPRYREDWEHRNDIYCMIFLEDEDVD
ncbi:hypothetical protein K440DRAFT_641411 [Wilcoxina mikolae CBS 423.85]|nr:hypothetical protein K440DRAFT_641411 [Wilcoxina mikolae CBS 423.85]